MVEFFQYITGMFGLLIQWVGDCFKTIPGYPGLGAVIVAVSITSIMVAFFFSR